jgi:hypothetical protein
MCRKMRRMRSRSASRIRTAMVSEAKVSSLDSRRCGHISINVVRPSAVALPK